MLTFAAGNTHAFRFDLKAEAAFILPQSRSDARLHAGRRNLACVVKRMSLIALRSRKRRGRAL